MIGNASSTGYTGGACKRISVFSLTFILVSSVFVYAYISFNGVPREWNPATGGVPKELHPVQRQDITQAPFTPMNTSYAPVQHQHVYYLKTHKTGSSTMHGIMAEFSRTHDLVPLMPSNGIHFNQAGKFLSSQVMKFKEVQKYDTVFIHHIYDPYIFQFLHKDTFTVTTLREPFSNFVSAFLYYKNMFHNAYLVRIPGNDPITELLRYPDKYDTKTHSSMTYNRQCMDMGYDLSKGFKNMTYVKEFIKLSDKRFDLVLIMEYFDESLIIMKRALNWNTEDILYYVKNAGHFYKKDKQNSTDLDKERRRLHALFSQPDILLYGHFLDKFKTKMEATANLKEEVDEFRSILVQVKNFCDSSLGWTRTLVVPAGVYNNRFEVTYFKCKMLRKDEIATTNFMKSRQTEALS